VTTYASFLASNDIAITLEGQLVAQTPAANRPEIQKLELLPGEARFTISTALDQDYTIEGSSNLIDWPTILDEFTATNTVSVRTVAVPPSPALFFRILED